MNTSIYTNKPGKLPFLLKTDPMSIKTFFQQLEFHFRLNVATIKENDYQTMIDYAGAGLIGITSLHSWWEGARERLVAKKSWENFKEELLIRAVPRGYSFDVIKQIRLQKQGQEGIDSFI